VSDSPASRTKVLVWRRNIRGHFTLETCERGTLSEWISGQDNGGKNLYGVCGERTVRGVRCPVFHHRETVSNGLMAVAVEVPTGLPMPNWSEFA
jgi:hypothetical protein